MRGHHSLQELTCLLFCPCRHRYAGDTSDADSQDGDAAPHAAADAEGDATVEGVDEAELDASVATSMDEAELQQQLRRLKASASQFPGRASSGGSVSSKLQQQQQQPSMLVHQAPLHTLKPAVAATAGRAYASLSQLSPVKEEQLSHPRCKSSAGQV